MIPRRHIEESLTDDTVGVSVGGGDEFGVDIAVDVAMEGMR
jgi:hypothetical protein